MSSASSTEAVCMDSMDRLEDAVRKSLVEKIAQDYFDETCIHVHISFQATFSNYLEEADRLPQEMRNTLHHHTSGLVNEETVNNALQEQKDFIIQNITNMDKNTVDGQDEFTPYLAIELTGPILLHLTQDFHLASRVSMSTRMPSRSSYHLRNSSITFECSTTYMETERHMSATVLETGLVDQDSFENVNNGALIINQSKLIKSRILHLLHDMCCGKTVRDESLTKHACSVIEGGKLKVQRDCLTNSHFNVSVSQTQTSTCLSHKHKLELVGLTRVCVCETDTNSC